MKRRLLKIGIIALVVLIFIFIVLPFIRCSMTKSAIEWMLTDRWGIQIQYDKILYQMSEHGFGSDGVSYYVLTYETKPNLANLDFKTYDKEQTIKYQTKKEMPSAEIVSAIDEELDVFHFKTLSDQELPFNNADEYLLAKSLYGDYCSGYLCILVDYQNNTMYIAETIH